MLLTGQVIPCKWNQPWNTPSQCPILDKGSLEKYGYRLQWYITDQFSFKHQSSSYIIPGSICTCIHSESQNNKRKMYKTMELKYISLTYSFLAELWGLCVVWAGFAGFLVVAGFPIVEGPLTGVVWILLDPTGCLCVRVDDLTFTQNVEKFPTNVPLCNKNIRTLYEILVVVNFH